MKKPVKSEFEQAADQQIRTGFISEFWEFLKHNKKWWLLPIIASLLIFGVLIFLGSTGIAPFIYTLF